MDANGLQWAEITALYTDMFTYQNIPVWRHRVIIQWALQIASAIVVVSAVAFLFLNVVDNVQDRNIPHSLSFLSREYQTPVGVNFIPYESSDTFGYALLVGVTNTLFVSVLGVILATALGTFIGVARLSSNWIASKLALVYIEFFRNVPLLVQLLFWLFIVLALPPVLEGYVIADLFYVNNASVSFPGPSEWGGPGVALSWVALVLGGIVAAVLLHRRLTKREIATGQASYPVVAAIAMAAAVAGVSWVALSAIFGDAPFTFTTPEPQGRFGHIENGLSIKASLLVLLTGLVMYTAAFIAEIVRAGIQSVSRGQVEAARALGLSPVRTLSSVTMPQAMRVIVPPLISQFLNLTKNSSLGAAVGYDDLTSIAITMTQTAPALVIFLLIMAAYLAMSLTYSLVGNLYNRTLSYGRR